MEQAGLNQLMWELHASLRACGIPVSPKIDPQVGINRRAAGLLLLPGGPLLP